MATSGQKTKQWAVHKFGGTSVLNAERYQGASRLLAEERKLKPKLQQAIVVSAMKGVTDDLIEIAKLASQQNDSYTKVFDTVKKRHHDAIQALGVAELGPTLDRDFDALSEVLRGIRITRTASERNIEFVSGHGEVWSAQILAAYLNKGGVTTEYLDAREVVIVEPREKSVFVKWDESQGKLREWFSRHPRAESSLLLITGFVASTSDGIATTLKRNGSDFSASIFGALLDAEEIVIWTDVDGVLSADPRLVPDAKILDEMTYHEMTELANFGAKVVHPATMEPAIRKNIPVWVRNTFNPACLGTKIHANAKSSTIIKGISAIEKVALLNLEGNGMVGVVGVAERLFGAIRSVGASAVMISQGSSEHSICIAVTEDQAARAKDAIEKTFSAEIHQGLVDPVEVIPNMSILAAVGDNMIEHPGIAGKFFTALGQAKVNIHAIAQGSSERNISAVVSGPSTKRALQSVHSSFYLSKVKIGVAVIGTGLVGCELLKQIKSQAKRLYDDVSLDIKVVATSNSKEMLLNGKPEPLNLEKLVATLEQDAFQHMIIVDTTASDEITKLYTSWLKRGFHVVAANKKANSGPMEYYREVRKATTVLGRKFAYSTNVCAGLPVIQTIRELTRTGDTLIELEGILSGTLSYLFNRFDGSKPFSSLVAEAKAKGLTEPDPMQDLSGMDVARKLVILAREAGIAIELNDISVQDLGKLKDDEFSKKLADAKSKNEILRYVAKIDSQQRATITLLSLPANHPFAALQEADNVVAIKTSRYSERPLVIQGPGAGAQVTAAGVFSDILKIALGTGGA